MNFKTAGALVTVLIGFPLGLAAQTPDSPVRPAVVVRTFNSVGVTGNTLHTAQVQAESILRDAGIEVSWLDCWLKDREPADAPSRCREPLGVTDLVLRIGSAKPGNGTQYVSMGFSLVNAADGKAPYLATVYADLVGSVARGAGADANQLLGRAIAHEIGHLLLGTNQHASTGLMRAAWSRVELRRDNARDWQFLSDEAGTMRAAIATRQASR